MKPVFNAIPTDHANTFWSGSPDAYHRIPERMISPGGGMPCRHCLQRIEKGEEMLVLAYRPFPALQPYAETGPIFLHAEPCSRYNDTTEIPPILSSPDYIVRGYGVDDRIVYGSGAVTPTEGLVERAEELLAQANIRYLHVRSARNNCYQCRIERSDRA